MRSLALSLAGVFAVSAASAFVSGCVDSTTFTADPPTIPTPRLPMNDAYLGSVHAPGEARLRPTFVWEPSTATAAGLHYELQYSTDRTFKADVVTIQTDKTSYQPTDSLPVSAVAPVGARYFWQLRACIRNSCSDYTRPWYVNVGRVRKDYNGDGYSDLAVGAPLNDTLYTDGGQVYVYYGSPVGTFDDVPDVLLATEDSTNHERGFGISVASVGDVDGDGFADLMVVLKETALAVNGQPYLYLGAASEQFKLVVDTVLPPLPGARGYGEDVASAGDVNGDGYGDLVVKSDSQDELTSYATVYLGAQAGFIDTTPDGELTWQGRGDAKTAGDVDGDGHADLIVGAYEDVEAGPGAGAAYLYRGGPGAAFDTAFDAKMFGRGNKEFFGEEVSSAGDLNGDGFADVAVGVRAGPISPNDLPGRAYVFFGGPTLDKDSDLTLVGNAPRDFFSDKLEAVGDVNADGYADLLVSARDTYLFYGAPGLTMDDESDAILPDMPHQMFSAGDLNGDGASDLGVTRPSIPRQIDLYLGSKTSPLQPRAAFTLVEISADEDFGKDVASLRAPLKSTSSRMCLANPLPPAMERPL